MSTVSSRIPRAEKPKKASIYRGVSFEKKSGMWIAQIKDHRTKILGRFHSELAVAHAYNDAAQHLGRSINLLPIE